LWKNKKRGLTLIELLVVVFIMGMIMAGLFLSLTKGEFASSVSMSKADLQAKIRRIMDWIVKDARQTNLIQINANDHDPTGNHTKFKTVTGIDSGGNYTFSTNYIEYNYTSASEELVRHEVNETGSILQSWVFNNITQSPFYTATGVPLAPGGILSSKKLIVVISGESQVRGSLVLNQTLTAEVKIRND
jgi:prepilin-type N-terminal cleavage/methylation domain-containing protein